MNNEIFGQVGDYTFVNSATSMSRDRIDDLFLEARADGSVKNSDILQKITESGELIEISDTIIVGHTDMRRRVELTSTKLRETPYCKKHANSILNNADFIKKIYGKDGTTLEWSCISSLDSFTKVNFMNGKKEHGHSLEKARAKRHK